MSTTTSDCRFAVLAEKRGHLEDLVEKLGLSSDPRTRIVEHGLVWGLCVPPEHIPDMILLVPDPLFRKDYTSFEPDVRNGNHGRTPDLLISRERGWDGADASLEISLKEYGCIWKCPDHVHVEFLVKHTEYIGDRPYHVYRRHILTRRDIRSIASLEDWDSDGMDAPNLMADMIAANGPGGPLGVTPGQEYDPVFLTKDSVEWTLILEEIQSRDLNLADCRELEPYVERVGSIYMFRQDVGVNCCEVTPSYEMWFYGIELWMKPSYRDLEETDKKLFYKLEGQRDSLESDLCACAENVVYRHCRGVKAQMTKNPGCFLTAVVNMEDTEEEERRTATDDVFEAFHEQSQALRFDNKDDDE